MVCSHVRTFNEFPSRNCVRQATKPLRTPWLHVLRAGPLQAMLKGRTYAELQERAV